MEVPAGRVVILNGTSSSGKSSIAQQFRDDRAALGEPWVIVGLDDYLAKVPIEWFAGDGFRGPFSDAGVCFEESAHGTTVRLGDFGQRLLAAYRRSVAACATSGVDVLVDEVAFDPGAVDDWHAALRGLRVTWVAVHCDVAVAEAREQARGDRIPGLVRAQDRIVHERAPYDGAVDSTRTPVAELARQLAVIVDGASVT
ncbi:MAG TPA: AAA family ATPase [Ilumatobacteraceae bacterium]